MSVVDRIKNEVESRPIVLFMKGTAQFPMCGFSSRTVQALKAAGAEDLHTVNVLEDPEIRANLPRYSNWPTFPQLFINGELIGGCDITIEPVSYTHLSRCAASPAVPCRPCKRRVPMHCTLSMCWMSLKFAPTCHVIPTGPPSRNCSSTAS